MVTIQTSSDWESKRTVQKGNVGERIVRQHLESLGLICYLPATDGAHGFDILAQKNKLNTIACEVKTKEMLDKWPVTGFNQSVFEGYRTLWEMHRIPVRFYFVDAELHEIYGNDLKELEKPYVAENGYTYPFVMRKNGRAVRLYHYDTMKVIKELTDDEVAEIRMLTNKSYSNSYSKKMYEERKANQQLKIFI